jgi:amidase
MALRIPTRDDLQRLAQRHYFTLGHDEAAAYHTVLTGIFPLLEQLHAMPEPHAPPKYPQRDPGGRPERQHDPYNAIVRRCSVVGAAQGPLAGKRIGLKDNVSIAGIPMTYGPMCCRGWCRIQTPPL